jgi:hypothetical protein
MHSVVADMWPERSLNFLILGLILAPVPAYHPSGIYFFLPQSFDKLGGIDFTSLVTT